MGGSAKLAWMFLAWVAVIVQVAATPAAAQSPPHPRKLPPAAAAAVTVSCVPCTTVSLQSPLCDAADMVHVTPEPVMIPEPVLEDPATTVTA